MRNSELFISLELISDVPFSGFYGIYFQPAYLPGLLFSSLIGLLFLRYGPKFVFVKMMDDSADPLRGSDGYVGPSVGDLVVVAQHGERLADEGVDGGFTLQVKTVDHGNLFGAGCRLDND